MFITRGKMQGKITGLAVLLIIIVVVFFLVKPFSAKSDFPGIGCGRLAEERITSWGDQGDGTYCNPVLNADYPDVDIVMKGDTFYMISSKKHMAPGMVILKSPDLVNWTSIGHVWPELSWAPEYNWDVMDGYGMGVWAGDLAYHEGLWYVYQIDYAHGLYMSTAEDIRGPWSEPHKMLSRAEVLDDPAVFWDYETGEAWLVANAGPVPGTPRPNRIKMFRMSWDGREIIDEGVIIHEGVGTEAAKIHKIDGQIYIFLAQWYYPDPARSDHPDAYPADRKQIVLRSTTGSMYGPYEERIVMQRGNGIIRSCSQGSIVQIPDGSWWYMHQLIQNIPTPFQGRPQMLQPVEWVDGWPVIGKDVTGDGIGEPVLRHEKPIHGHPITKPATDDNFESDRLGPQWEWNHNPRNTHWSLTERRGFLRLKASVPVDTGGFWKASNTLSQRIMGTTTGTATARFDISGMQPGQRAGFVRWGAVFNLLGVHVEDDGRKMLFFDGNGQNWVTGPEIAQDIIYIRTTNEFNQARYYYSLDGENFERFGPEFTIKMGISRHGFHNWSGDRLGFFCWNEISESGHIDVDWFCYDYYDGPCKDERCCFAEAP